MAQVAVYIRWSTEDQGNGTTLEVQREACLAYCARQGWAVEPARIYVDDGWSGSNLHRPGLNHIRAAVQAGDVDTVVVYRLDRLSRDLADATGLVGREWRGRAVVRSATEDLQPEADEGWLNYSFRAAFADYERRVIRQRTYAGKLRRLQEGFKVAGKAPYGYVRGERPGMFAVDEEKASVVRALFEKCARENMGLPALCRWLNEMGYKPPRAASWAVGNLRPILSNPVYKGRVIFGRQRFLKSSAEEPGPWRRLQAPLVDVAAAPGTLPAIVPEELWEQAQVALQRRRAWMEESSGRSLGSDRLLTGLIFCRCGGRLTPKSQGRRRDRAYYRCLSNEQSERCPYQPGYIEVSVLDRLVTEQFLKRVRTRGYREQLEESTARTCRAEVTALEQQLVALQQQLTETDGELRFIDSEYRKRRITIEEARRLRGQAEEDREDLVARRGALERMLAEHRQALGERQATLGQVDLAQRWGELEDQQRRQLVRQFIRRVEALRVKESKELSLHIEWHFATEGAADEAVEVALPEHGRQGRGGCRS